MRIASSDHRVAAPSTLEIHAGTPFGVRLEVLGGYPLNLATMLDDVWRARLRKDGRLRVGAGLASALRDAARRHGETAPIGDGDSKTASPGTYRPVGPTCPTTCPYLDAGCYALGGNVRTHQAAAAATRDAALRAAAVVMVWGAATGRVARLHVSGDMGKGRPDPRYVAGLAALGYGVRRLAGLPDDHTVAWTYTHHVDGPFRATLRAAGIAVRLSDRGGVDGAITVASRAHARDLRAASPTPIAVCPAQLGKNVTCSPTGEEGNVGCTLCWTRPDVTIAFIAHGQGKAQVAAAVLGID